MGEEEKKVEEKPKKVEEEEKKEEAKEEKKEKSNEAAKVEKTPKEPPPPPPPQEIVLRVYMHCEGCARKIRTCLKGFQGVEDVTTDCKTHKVVVKGEKADPLKVLARVQRKSHRHVELLSPIPPPPAEPKKTKDKEIPKPLEKKEPQVITVVLKVHMHCEACAQEIKKRIERMKGVEIADTDLKSSLVTVKGVFDPAKLVEYVHKKTGKHAIVIKQEPEKKKEEVKGNEATEKKKCDEGGEKEGKKAEESAPAVPTEAGKEKKDAKPEEVPAAGAGEKDTKKEMMMEMIKKNEFYYYFPPQNYQIYPPRVATEVYPPATQMFSDENPNACSVM
ncbi:heavy metal-associated isoprenylated plant protein 7-like [Apium graveolens]|uniref:HMA domain-containing protein n=1 Tax=Apium graveolens TaxID=4045 RepID=A0A6L5B7W4_APIGR|nr:hypothetical protein AG4045_009868 [Apium graveolens]